MNRVITVIIVSFVLLSQGQRYQEQRNQHNQQNINRNIPQIPQDSFITGNGVPCPEKNGRFPSAACDSYIECENGVGQEKVCPDGLLFNAAAGIFRYPCQYPIDVDCTGRASVQPAQPTHDCPHQFGYFRLGDSSNCGQFKNCVDGRGYTFDCPEGLAFSEESYRCDWPDKVSTCDAEAYLGFTCPKESEAKSFPDSGYRFFRSPINCEKYYICINDKPRLYNCGEGNAFNELTNSCDAIENVTSCLIGPPL